MNLEFELLRILRIDPGEIGERYVCMAERVPQFYLSLARCWVIIVSGKSLKITRWILVTLLGGSGGLIKWVKNQDN